MGSGIAQVAAVAGHDVVLRDVTDAALGKGTASIEKSLGRFVAKGTLEASDGHADLGEERVRLLGGVVALVQHLVHVVTHIRPGQTFLP